MKIKNAQKLSIKEAKKIIVASKGKFMSAIFEKTDGKDRNMQFRYGKKTEDPGTGMVTVKEFPSNEFKTINIQKLKYLKANKLVFKLPYAVVKRVKKV